jgi:alpha-beta hydrolase superfamily lysophospholipase
MRLICRIPLVVALSFGALLSYMVSFEDQFIYFPSRELQHKPSDVGLQFEEVRFQASDGERLFGWYMPHPSARFTVLHFHGNAGNISHRLPLYRRWHAMGLAVFAFDYRGYGKSTGKPGEAGLYNDARAAWLQLTEKYGTAPETVIITGRSLGAAVAAKLAGEVEAAGLALETPFTSIPDMAAHHYPLLPLRWLVRSQYDLETMVQSLHMPLLLISAESDEIVPAGMAEQIFGAGSEPKTHRVLAGGHNDFDMRSDKAYSEIWLAWLRQLSALQEDGPVGK